MALPTLLSAATQQPKNLGNSLAQVVARDLAAKSGQATNAPGTGSSVDMGDRAMRDAQGRILVTVYLKNPAARPAVASVPGVQIKAEDMSYQGGALDVYIPAERVTDLANKSGVSTVLLALAPVFDVGSTTSQGVHQHRVDQITDQDATPVTGITGAGVTVGVLSNSFDASGSSAENDTASGDLPGPGNPNNSTPVLVLEEFFSADEGRAMCQIVHDMAPAAKLAFRHRE